MSEPFKPGDVVRTIVPHRVVKSVDPAHAIDRFLHFEDGTIGRPQNYELVEPSVPVSMIRGICLDRLEKFPEGIANNSQLAAQILANNEAIRDLFEELTGEPLRKD